MNDIDAKTIPTGRHKGRCMNDVAEDDPTFVVTIYEAIGDPLNATCVCSHALYQQCKDHVVADQMARDLDPGDPDET